jgi:hypothetical protein
VTPIFTYQPVQLVEGNPEREGILVFRGADLLALLVRLPPKTRDGQRGLWFLAAGFGPCADAIPPLFRNPKSMEPWFAEQMSRRTRRAGCQAEDLESPVETWTLPRRVLH